MSRTQWCCLTALLAIVMGLLCGPVGAAPSYADASPSESVAVTVGEAATVTVAPDLIAEAFDAGTPVPGCRQPGDHDSEPAVPTRARAAYDQAPGLAPWGLPAATGALPAEPPSGIRVRAPVPATPTPVELSVLRV
ncbi:MULTISPECIES: hypothetical protein [Streptomyces]|uniref:Secreted protein n=1 Tax=Streptomyces cyaneofuscatus TaxID=66883 RepID=A0ABZ1EYM1_9ACTN|nr:hypothetical protein [Streptomyces cyaneofuscatus]WSB09133.1 hypothetical protein OG849_18725 [Streptomyces cyaneofuscatus]WSD47333.1 hypothetical protein OG857_16680 [Streptomyces cyaneofuscatus]WTA90725.1 hypothetical protein OG323_17760 [Streptomyces cyaneofuscatus]